MVQKNIIFAFASVWVLDLVSNIKGETWTRVFENRELRRIFGPKRNEVTGD
jgi:hypothetical protein